MGTLIPVFCGSCGREGGWCPEENMTFICWLCNDCAARYGEIASTMMMPDEVFWARVKEAQLNDYGRELSQSELQAIVQEGASPLARLIISGQ